MHLYTEHWPIGVLINVHLRHKNHSKHNYLLFFFENVFEDIAELCIEMLVLMCKCSSADLVHVPHFQNANFQTAENFANFIVDLDS